MRGDSKKKPAIKALQMVPYEKKTTKAVILFQNTSEIELAMAVRQMIQSINPWNNLKLKVVEKSTKQIKSMEKCRFQKAKLL